MMPLAQQQALLDNRPPSVGAMLQQRVAASGPREAFRYLDAGRWVSLTWEETKAAVFEVAAGLISLGVQIEDRVAIAAGTRMEWILADLGIMCAGAATTTVYPTTQHEDVAFILGNSASKVVFAEDDFQVAKVVDHLDELSVVKIIQLSGKAQHELVMSWNEFRELGRRYLAEHPASVDDAIAATGPDTLATLIYTSGTTGRPKGVRLTHQAWTYEGASIEAYDIIYPDDVQYLWLPLSHVFGKALIAIQLKIGFCTAVDGSIEKIVDNLGEVKPTFMAGAPRIFEKVRAKVMTGAQSGVKGKIFNWAFDVGYKTIPGRLEGHEPSGLLGLQYALADKLVFSKLKERMGGNIRFFVSGSAALSREVQEWFYAAGLLILEGYGLTETSAATFVNNPRATRFGTVGPAVPGTEAKIAADGEIMVRGPGVMNGYHDNPEATAEVLTEDGWFSTGDIGEFDDHGYLRITDRKKDLIKTSGGKYVAPQKVEAAVKAASPYVSQVLVHGEGRKYISALITLDPDAINEWAQANGHESGDIAALAQSAVVKDLIDGHVAQANRKLERWETIKKFEIMSCEFSVDAGEVTPSLKIRRKAVEKKYASTLNSLYED